MREKTAFISVYQKDLIFEFAVLLEKLNYEIYAYGSTAKELKRKNIDVYEVIDKTGMHFSVIEAIRKGYYKNGDFELRKPDIIIADLPEIDENEFSKFNSFPGKDNANLLRFACEYYEDILIVSDPKDYPSLIEKINVFEDDIPIETKRYYAAKALNLVSYYEALFSRFLYENILLSHDKIAIPLNKKFDFKYGENRHQVAKFYSIVPENNQVKFPVLVESGEFNLNHYLDISLANEVISLIDEPACVITKHRNIVAFSVSDKISSAFEKSLKSDEISSFSAICAFNRIVDEDTASKVLKAYIECIVAVDFQKSAMDILKKKPELKIVKMPLKLSGPKLDFFYLDNGFGVQERDDTDIMDKYKVLTRRKPTLDELRDLKYAAIISKYSNTYSAVLFSENSTVSISEAQASVYDAIKVLIEKLKYKNSIFKKNQKFVLAINGALNIKALLEISNLNISAIIQFSDADDKCLEFCEKNNICLVVSRLRHFKH